MTKLIVLVVVLLICSCGPDPVTTTPVVVERCLGSVDVVICANCGIVSQSGTTVYLVYESGREFSATVGPSCIAVRR